MNKILVIFLLGISILIVAIILNLIANLIGFTTWYGFLSGFKNNGFSGVGFLSYLFLFILYPFLLGMTSYYVFILLNN